MTYLFEHYRARIKRRRELGYRTESIKLIDLERLLDLAEQVPVVRPMPPLRVVAISDDELRRA